jgi:hypothetical protein
MLRAGTSGGPLDQFQIWIRDRGIELVAAELLARDPASYRASIFLSRDILHAKPPAFCVFDVNQAVQHRISSFSYLAGENSLQGS